MNEKIEVYDMKPTCLKIFESGCMIICIIATICFTSYCLQQYFLNEDTSLVHFRKYHKRLVDIYPAVSLCFSNYLSPSVFNNDLGKMMDYKRFLIGIKSDDEYAKLDYDNITMDLNDYVLDAFLVKQLEDSDLDQVEEDNKVSQDNGNDIENESGDIEPGAADEDFNINDKISWNIDKYLYTSANIDPNYKCWTFEIPYIDKKTTFRRFVVRLKRSVFRGSIRPTNEDFKVVISYPGQFLSARVTKSEWRKLPGLKRNDLRMEFNIQNMIILRKRNKSKARCKMQTTRDDEDKLRQLVQAVGCRPLHIYLNTSYPDCKNDNIIGNASAFFGEMEEYEGPCRQVEKIMYFYDEYEDSFLTNDEIEKGYEIVLNFQGNTFMEIEQVRAYDIQSLIGNGGGYVGVFLGVAVIQLPTLLYKIHSAIQQLF